MEYSSTKKVSLPGISFSEFDENSSDDDSQMESHDNDVNHHGNRGHPSDVNHSNEEQDFPESISNKYSSSSSSSCCNGGDANAKRGYDGFQSYNPFNKSSNTNYQKNDQLQTPSRARANSPSAKHVGDDYGSAMTPSKTRSLTPSRGLFSSILPANTPKRGKTASRAQTPAKTAQQQPHVLSSYNYQSKTPNDRPTSKTPGKSTAKKKKRPKTPTISPTGLKAIQTAELLVEEAQASETVSERVEAVIGSALENVKGRFVGFGRMGFGGASASGSVTGKSDGVPEVKKIVSTVDVASEVRNQGQRNGATASCVERELESRPKKERTSLNTANGNDSTNDSRGSDERVEFLTVMLRDANIGNDAETDEIDATLESKTNVPGIRAEQKSGINSSKLNSESTAEKFDDKRQQEHESGEQIINASTSQQDDDRGPDAIFTSKAGLNKSCTAKVDESKEGCGEAPVMDDFNDGFNSTARVSCSDINETNANDSFIASDDDRNPNHCITFEVKRDSSCHEPDQLDREFRRHISTAPSPVRPSYVANIASLDAALPNENLLSSQHKTPSLLHLDEEADDFVPTGLKDFLSKEESKLASLLSSIDQMKSTPGKIDSTILNEMDEDVLKATPDFGEISRGLGGWSSVKKKLDLSRGDNAEKSVLSTTLDLSFVHMEKQQLAPSSPESSHRSLKYEVKDTQSSMPPYQPSMKSFQKNALGIDEVFHANDTTPNLSPPNLNKREESSESIEPAEDSNPQQRQEDVLHKLLKLPEEKKDDEGNDLRKPPKSTATEEGTDECEDDGGHGDVLASVQQFFEEAENAFLNAMASPMKTSNIEVDGAGTFVEDYIEPKSSLVAEDCEQELIDTEANVSVGPQSLIHPHINETDEMKHIESLGEASEDDECDILESKTLFGLIEDSDTKMAEEISSLSLSEKNRNLENVDQSLVEDEGRKLTGIANSNDGGNETFDTALISHGRFLDENLVFDSKTTCTDSTSCSFKSAPKHSSGNKNDVSDIQCMRNYACRLEREFEDIEQEKEELKLGTDPGDLTFDEFPLSTGPITLDFLRPNDNEWSTSKTVRVDDDIHACDDQDTPSQSEPDQIDSKTGGRSILPNYTSKSNFLEVQGELVKNQSKNSIGEEVVDAFGSVADIFDSPGAPSNPNLRGVAAESITDDEVIGTTDVVNQSPTIQDISMAEPSMMSATKENENLHLDSIKSLDSDRIVVDSPPEANAVSNPGASDEDVNESLFMPNMSLDVTLSPVKDSPQVPMEDVSEVENEASSEESDDESFFPNRDLCIGKRNPKGLPTMQSHTAKCTRNESLEAPETRLSQSHQPHIPHSKNRRSVVLKYRTTPVHPASRKSRLSWDSSSSKSPLSSSVLGETVRTAGVSSTKTPKPIQSNAGMKIVRTGTKTNYSRKVAPLWSPPSTMKPAKKRSKNALTVDTAYEVEHMARKGTIGDKYIETVQDETVPSLLVKSEAIKVQADVGENRTATAGRDSKISLSTGNPPAQLSRNRSRKNPPASLRKLPSMQHTKVTSDESSKKKSSLVDSSATKSMRRSLVSISRSHKQINHEKPTSSNTKALNRQFHLDNPLQQERLKRLATQRSIKHDTMPNPKKIVDRKAVAIAKPPSFLSRDPPKGKMLKSSIASETEMMENVKPFKARPILGSSSTVQSRFRTTRSKSCPRPSQLSPPTPPKPHPKPFAIKPPSFLGREAHPKATPKKVETLGESIQHYLNRGGFRDVPPVKPVDRNLLLTPNPPSFLQRESTKPRQKVETLGESIHHYMNHLRDLPAPSPSTSHGNLPCGKHQQKNKCKARDSSPRVPYYIRAQQEHAACKEKLKLKAAEIEAVAKRMNQVKARSLPKTTYIARPINIEHSQVKLTMPRPPKLSLDTRMEDRHRFDEQIREQQAHEDAVKQEEDRLRNAKADQELRLKRQLHIDEGGLVFRAKEIITRLE